MEFSEIAKEFEEISILFQYLALSPYNEVVFNLGEDSRSIFWSDGDIQMSLDGNGNLILLDVPTGRYTRSVNLSLGQLRKVVAYLKKTCTNIEDKEKYKTRWEEIAEIVAVAKEDVNPPAIDVRTINSHSFEADACCTVCGYTIYRTSHFTKEQAIKACKDEYPNFCYNCGTKLRNNRIISSLFPKL